MRINSGCSIMDDNKLRNPTNAPTRATHLRELELCSALYTALSQKFPPKRIWSESTDPGQILFKFRSSSHLAGFHLDHHTLSTFHSHSLHIPLKILPTKDLSTLAYDLRWPFHICTLYFNSSHFNQARASNISKNMSNSIHIYILVNAVC